MPTVPGFLVPGGNGLLVIWWAASVIAYASMTGDLNVFSNSFKTWGGNDAEEERMNRSAERFTIPSFLPALARMAWCMVGTAVYQLGCASSSQAKNFNALNPGVQKMLAPAQMLERIAAIRP